MTVLFELFAVLLAARLAGEGLHRLGLPASLGEIAAGAAAAAAIAVFGAQVPALAALPDSPVLGYSAEVGIFALILLAGIELHPTEIVRGSLRSALAGIGGALLPLAGGVAVAWAVLPAGPELGTQALLVGVALAITALPASIRVLEDLGIVHGEIGRTILAAALVDDIVGLVLLAVLVAAIETGGAPDAAGIALLLLKVAGFFAATIGFGQHVYPHIRRGVALMQAMSAELSALVLVALAYGAVAELLGLHWILGPFMAGIFFEPARVGAAVYREVRRAVVSLTSGVLGPIFFFSIGLGLDFAAFGAAPGLLAAVLAVAFLGKILGAGVPAALAGMAPRAATAVGVGMCARGAVELIVLSVAAESGLLAPAAGADGPVAYLYSVLVVAAVVTTLATPLLLRAVLPPGGGRAPPS